MNELINQVFQMEGPVKLCVLLLLLQISGRSRGQGFEDTLKDPPEIDRPPQSQSVKSGGTAAFFCYATGQPSPSFTWKKNGNKLRLTDYRCFKFFYGG